jgi:hypothetical protein
MYYSAWTLVVTVAAFWIGYRRGWKDCRDAHVRTVTGVGDGSTITINSAGPTGLRAGDRIWIDGDNR